jgi:hypothetical protein
MNKIVTTIKQMTVFQKIQLFSALLPLYSFIFVFIVSYYVCWKKKLGYLLLTIVSVIYFMLLCLLLNFGTLLIVKYIVGSVISIIGNYCLVSIQMKSK